MPALQLSNDLGLPAPKAKPSIQPIDPALELSLKAQASAQHSESATLPSASLAGVQTQFMFELPRGYIDSARQLHRRGVMRLALTVDEIEPMGDPRVQSNPAYATVIILSRVMLSLGTLSSVSPAVIEGLFAGDLNYLQNFYSQINGLG